MAYFCLFEVKSLKRMNEYLILVILLSPVANFGNTPLFTPFESPYSIVIIEYDGTCCLRIAEKPGLASLKALFGLFKD